MLAIYELNYSASRYVDRRNDRGRVLGDEHVTAQLGKTREWSRCSSFLLKNIRETNRHQLEVCIEKIHILVGSGIRNSIELRSWRGVR